MSRCERLFSGFREHFHSKNFGITGEGIHSVNAKARVSAGPAAGFPESAGGDHREQWKLTPDSAVDSGGG